jgi:hypothetical protein
MSNIAPLKNIRKSSFQLSRFLRIFSDFPKFSAGFSDSVPISKKNNPHFRKLCYIEDVLSSTGQVRRHSLAWKTVGLSISGDIGTEPGL